MVGAEELTAVEEAAHKEMEEEAAQAVAEPFPPGMEALEEVYTDAGAGPPWTRSSPPHPAALFSRPDS